MKLYDFPLDSGMKTPPVKVMCVMRAILKRRISLRRWQNEYAYQQPSW